MGVGIAFTRADCEPCFPNNDTYAKFRGEYIHKDKFLDSWQRIVDYTDVTKHTTFDPRNKLQNLGQG
eukprot:scaffold73065_cov36-Tisochrysis_lutea.AAC.3